MVNNSFPSNIKTTGTVLWISYSNQQHRLRLNCHPFSFQGAPNSVLLRACCLSPLTPLSPTFCFTISTIYYFSFLPNISFLKQSWEQCFKWCSNVTLVSSWLSASEWCIIWVSKQHFFSLTNVKLWSAGNHMNAAEWKCRLSVIRKCQLHDSAGECVLSAMDVWGLSGYLMVVF